MTAAQPTRVTSKDQPLAINLLGHYAGFISRLMAFLIDTGLITILVVTTTWFVSVTGSAFRLGAFLGLSPEKIPFSRQVLDVISSSTTTGILTAVFILAYHVFFWVFAGQTPGKALLGLRLVTSTGRRLSPWRAALRFTAYFISALPLYLGFLWVLVDDRRQAWHDKIAGTLVIYTWAARPDERFLQEEIRQVEALSPSENDNLIPSQDQSTPSPDL